ncbi:Uncharacterised protein [Klebsiella quasipneumoniae]|uniref:DUF2975 domain-containing protein n=1 Tax=Klebsiella quasipneumoniae TaxID=1463165 RepID=UPI0012582E0F|nr:DUF2975 domain-containing protein [Klebsiella quasipneumoniae]MBC4862437.1 DUF2975 domain-containing protein [Klebsiella quasipneumoniae]VAP79427.1 Uncharacterised protein [Klebsiella quasipneumoniae]VAP88362.1 Uncharacterised protein [Klebsiella quasipneumoniae]VAP89787.1 Uncharacterised protein [Klebsiella quasipneumoniae]
MKQTRTRLSLAIISGILPLFFMLALIVPLWIFFTGERYFLSTLLHFAEVPLTDNPAQAPGMARRLLLLALLYLPAGLFAFAIWQGMKVTRSVRQRSVLSLSLAHSVRYIALAMVGMGILLPVCRFLIPLLAWWPQSYYQVVFLLSDGVLLLTGSLLFVTFHAMLHGIRAEEENKEFI